MSAITALQRYYAGARGVGHTKLLIDAVKAHSGRAIVVVGHASQRNEFRGQLPPETIVLTVDDISDGSASGYDLPIMLDNFALQKILGDAQDNVERFEAKRTVIRELARKLLEATE